MVKSKKSVLAILLALTCLFAFMPLMTSQSYAAKKKLTVSPTKKTIYVGKTVKVKANKTANWTVKSGKKVVKTSKKTKKVKSINVKGLKAGTAKIKVTKKGYASKTVTITVKKKAAAKKAVTGVTIKALNKKDDPATKVVVGTTLSATDVTPDNATVTYQWKADGVAIAGATKANYTVKYTEIGKAITVEVTGTGKYNKTVTSAPTKAVEALEADGTVAIKSLDKDGKEVVSEPSEYTVGTVLKATGLSANNDVDINDAVDYTWYKVTTSTNGSEIKTAIGTGETYTIAKADIGTSTIKVVATPKANVTVAKTAKLESAGTPIKVSNAITATIQANGKDVTKATVGTALTAVVNPADANVEYQWSLGGAAIKGATSATYTPTEKGTYTVTITPTAAETTYAKTVVTVDVETGDKTISAVTLTDTSVTADRKDVITGDTLALKVTTKGTYGDIDLTSNYDVTYVVTDTAGKTTEYKDADEASKAAKIGDSIKAVVEGTGDYAGSTVESNAIIVTKLNTAENAFKDVGLTVTNYVATVSKLPEGATIVLQGKIVAKDGTSTWETINEPINKDGKINFNYTTYTTKGYTGYQIIISGSNYAGTKTVEAK